GLCSGVACVVAVAARDIGGVLWQRAESGKESREAQQRATAAATAAEQTRTAKQSPSVQGVTDTEILLGMAAPFSGPAKELGRGMKTGIDIAFASVNDAGGVNGRKLKLVALDDGYEPDRTTAVMKELNEQRK